MNIGILYVVYFVVFIIVFLLCYFSDIIFPICNTEKPCKSCDDILLYFLIASIVTLVVIFMSVIWIDTNNLPTPELIALDTLVVITFLLPIIIIIILAFRKESVNNSVKCYIEDQIDPCNKDPMIV